MKFFLTVLFLISIIPIGCGTSLPDVGREGQKCFDDGTCNVELFCSLEEICRRPEDDCMGRVCGSSPNIGYDCGTCKTGLCFSGSCVEILVSITGGTFNMGSDTGGSDEQPVHSVTVPSFEMMKTEVTVELYRQCVNDGACTAPDTGTSCNWDVSDRDDHPVNCVDWQQAVDFCSWAGGRLPSEAEWEFAARGGGQNIDYPWGNDTPTCSLANYSSGCESRTWTVCNATAGNTTQGLCDMAGNVWEWVQDWYHDTYTGAPADGSAWESPISTLRVLRGGSWYNYASSSRVSSRDWSNPTFRHSFNGFRCAR